MNSKIGLKRNVIDKYYTKNEIAELCVNYVIKYVNIKINDMVIEPSAGNGSFINLIKTITNNYIFYDIEPEHDEIIKGDFRNITTNNSDSNDIHIIGN